MSELGLFEITFNLIFKVNIPSFKPKYPVNNFYNREMAVYISRCDFLDIYAESKGLNPSARANRVCDQLIITRGLNTLSESQLIELKKKVSAWCTTLKRCWEQHNRDKTRVKKTIWGSTDQLELVSVRKAVGGRPKKRFVDCGEKSRCLKARESIGDHQIHEAVQRTIMWLKDRKEKRVANEVNEILNRLRTSSEETEETISLDGEMNNDSP